MKKGDRVIVYGVSGNFKPIRGVGIVDEILEGDVVRFNSNDTLYSKYEPVTGGWDLTMLHRKSCRKIKPVKLAERK